MFNLFKNIKAPVCLEESELLKKLNQAQFTAMIGSWDWDLKTNKDWWSDYTYEIFGLDKNFVPGFEANTKYIHPDDVEEYKKTVEHCIKTGESWEMKLRVITKSGILKYCQAKGNIVYDADGKQSHFIGTLADITANKKVEDELASINQKYETLVEKSNDGILILRGKGTLDYVNQEICRMTGYTKDEVIGTLFTKYIAPDFKEIISERYTKRIKGESVPDRYEMEVLSNEGKRIPVEVNSTLIKFDGEMETMSILRDITERKIKDTLLAEEYSKEKALLEGLGEAVISVDADGKITMCNLHMEKMLNMKSADIIGREIEEIFKIKDIKGFTVERKDRPIIRAFLDKTEIIAVEMTLVSESKEIPVEMVASPVSVNGKIVGSMVIIRDVTIFKQNEKKLRLSEEHFHSIVTIVGEGIIFRNKDGEITSANPSAESILGMSESEIIGKSCDSISIFENPIHEDGSVFTADQQPCALARATFKPQLNVTMGIHPRGKSVVWLSLNSYPIILSGESKPQSIVTTIRDITKLKELDKTKELFLTIATHGLKSPLTPIKTQTQLLLAGDYGELNHKQKEALEMIYRNEEALNVLASNVLDISKIKSHELKLSLERVGLGKIVEDAVSDAKSFAEQKRISLSLLPIPEMTNIVIDEARIRQVLSNLIDNAIKFTPEGGTVNVEVKKAENEVIVSVKDTGIGISGDDIAKLFVPFFQVKNDIYINKGRGTGLGLAIAKGIVEAHGGKIWAESDGNGSIFIFGLPIKN